MNFRPTYSVLNVKLDVSQLSDIPVSRQNWLGWPEGTADDLTLAQIGIPRQHELQLSALPKNSSHDVSIYIYLQLQFKVLLIFILPT